MVQSDDEYQRLSDELYHEPHAWRDYARCLDPSPEEENIIFPWGKHQPTPEETQEWIDDHCGECPVRQQCLDLAVKTESIGVFGGFSLTPADLNKLNHLRRGGHRVTVDVAERTLGGRSG